MLTKFTSQSQAFEEYGEETRRDWVAYLRAITCSCLDAALEYAAKRDWFVFPADIEDGEKKGHKSGKNTKDKRRWAATKDAAQIRRDFKRWPDAIGIPTGPDNGFFVLEVDTLAAHDKDGIASLAKLEAEHGKLPDTLQAESPSGSVHFYFQYPTGGRKVVGRSSKLAPGIDIKGWGGMVIAPPSRRADGLYFWRNDLPIAAPPKWLLDAVSEEAESVDNKESGINSSAPNNFEKYGDEARKPTLDKIAFMLRTIPNPDLGWDEWNDVGMATWHGAPNDEGLRLFDAWSQKAAKYRKKIKGTTGKQRTAAKWKKYFEFPLTKLTVGKLFYLADEADKDWRAKYEAEQAKSVTTSIEIIRASDVVMRAKEWLWEGHLLRGGLELLTGLPGLGKSQVQISYMACATAGLPWPDGAAAIKPVNVVMVTAEDAIDTEVVPRLAAAGADLTRVHILKYIRTDKLKRQFLLAEDLARLEQVIAKIGNVGLVCIDPITAYMGGKMDSHKATEVRSQLGPLKDFAERSNVAVSAITHPAKNASARAIDHFIGSQAFIAAARVGHACFEETEEDEASDGKKIPTGRYLFTNVKHSAHTRMPTLAYKIETAYVHPEPFVQIETSRVVWEKDAVNISADEVIAAARIKGKAREVDTTSDVAEYLRMMIDAGKGWCKQTEIAEQAKALGFSDKELRTVRKKLGIISKREGGLGDDGWWMWGWPEKRPLRF